MADVRLTRSRAFHEGCVRVAHVGCGAWGQNLVRELRDHPAVELVLLIDPDAKALARCHTLVPSAATASSIRAIEEQAMDAVVIASPETQHASHALAALRTSNVFLEKPMTTSVAEARTLLAACKTFHRIGMVGHLLHYHGAVRTLLANVREGRIGVPRAFRSARLCVKGSRKTDSSVLWSLAPHDISVLRALDASAVRLMTVDVRSVDSAVANAAEIHMRMASGLMARVEVSRAHQHKVRRMEVVGEDGTIVFDDVAHGPKLTLRWGGEVGGLGGYSVGGRIEPLAFDTVPPLRAEVDTFVRCVATRTTPQTDFSEGYEVVELLERAHRLGCGTGRSTVAMEAR